MNYETAKMYANNCDKLANLLELIPDEQHDQANWIVKAPECGTVCCAMGWAAQSRQFEGLKPCNAVGKCERTVKNFGRISVKFSIGVTLNGQRMDFENAGAMLFGREVVRDVFMRIDASKKKTIKYLREYAEQYCNKAKYLAP